MCLYDMLQVLDLCRMTNLCNVNKFYLFICSLFDDAFSVAQTTYHGNKF
jgi:hypothetical protein